MTASVQPAMTATMRSGVRRLAPPEPDSASEIRSMSSGSLTPPSSPDGSPLKAEGAEKVQFSGMNSAQIYALYREQQRERKSRKRSKQERITHRETEEANLRVHRLLLTFLCYTPLFLVWIYLDAHYGGVTSDLWALPISVVVACYGTALLKETAPMPSLAMLYPALSFAAGVVNGSFSQEAVQEQKLMRLAAVCAHGVLSGRLTVLAPKKAYSGGMGLAIWVAFGEIACMMSRDFWGELGSAASAYSMLSCVVPVAMLFPTIIMSVWVWLFGVEQTKTKQNRRNVLYRVCAGAAWVLSVTIPIGFSLAAASATFYLMIPVICEKMIFVAPWGVLFEVGSVVSCGYVSWGLDAFLW